MLVLYTWYGVMKKRWEEGRQERNKIQHDAYYITAITFNTEYFLDCYASLAGCDVAGAERW